MYSFFSLTNMPATARAWSGQIRSLEFNLSVPRGLQGPQELSRLLCLQVGLEEVGLELEPGHAERGCSCAEQHPTTVSNAHPGASLGLLVTASCFSG